MTIKAGQKVPEEFCDVMTELSETGDSLESQLRTVLKIIRDEQMVMRHKGQELWNQIHEALEIEDADRVHYYTVRINGEWTFAIRDEDNMYVEEHDRVMEESDG
ncbi:MAG: hypothetical protein V3R57_08300 [Candidatus Bathyarchaeia archaeon]